MLLDQLLDAGIPPIVSKTEGRHYVPIMVVSHALWIITSIDVTHKVRNHKSIKV